MSEADKLQAWENWRTRIVDAIRILSSKISVDIERANEIIPLLTKEAGWDCTLQPDRSWSHLNFTVVVNNYPDPST
jgi:hypothetical protein